MVYSPDGEPLDDQPDQEAIEAFGKEFAKPHGQDGDERDGLPEFAELPEGPFGKPKTVRLKDKTSREKRGMANPTHPDRIKAAERAAEIFELKKKGWTEREIAKKFGIGIGGVNKILTRELDRVNRKVTLGASHMKQLQNEKLDFLWKALWPQMELGNHKVIEMGLRVMERQAKLNGWDEPEKRQIEMAVDYGSDTELIELAKRYNVSVPAELEAAVRQSMAETTTDAEFIIPDALEDKTGGQEETTGDSPSSQETQGSEGSSPG